MSELQVVLVLWPGFGQYPENDTAKCETGSMEIEYQPGHRHVDKPVALSTVSLRTPTGMPAGCRVEEKVAAVSVDRDGAPPTARRADLNTAGKTVTIRFNEALIGTAPAASQFKLQSSTGANLATATGVTVAGDMVTVTFATIPAGAEMIAYTAPTTNPFRDTLKNKTPSFTREL